jgi:hypothetical protein
MTNMLVGNIPQLDANRLYFGFFEDFLSDYVSGDAWTLVATDSGTATLQDEAGGFINLAPSDGTVADNDEIYLKRTKECFKIVNQKPIIWGWYGRCDEANTDDVNVAVGLASGVAANTIVDDGGGVDSDFSGAMFYKVDGGDNWNVIYSDGTTQTDVELTATNSLTGSAIDFDDDTLVLLECEIHPYTSAKCDIVFKVDDEVVYKMKDKTYSSATEAQFFIGGKNGSANNESIESDFAYCYQKR